MASKSRAAQQALSELEKSSAQFEDQLVEAAKFIGSELDAVSTSASRQNERKDLKKVPTSHGKEEWLLKWLLKKLQAPKDDVPRKTALSWNLILLALRRLPLPVAARILGERKFVAIVQKTLEEAKQSPAEGSENIKSSSLEDKETTKKSKKRKRFGEAAGKSSSLDHGVQSLLSGILAVVDFIVDSTRPNSGQVDNGRDSEFSAEYMRTVLRSSAEDSAKLLGIWLQVLKKHDILSTAGEIPWLSSFVEIWQLHTVDENYLMHFSLHCTLPLLSLLGNLSVASSFGTQIEQLLARNIIISSKAAKEENAESTLLNDLTKLAVISDSANASHLFGIAIRSIQPQGAKRRRPIDETWLQAVFSSLGASMPLKRVEQNGKAVRAMIQSAILHKVDLELEVLRSVTAEYAIPEGGETSWELLQLVIKLDANAFLIPNTEQDLLGDLFTRVNQVSIDVENPNTLNVVVEDVVLPLMEAFAKARDLTGFMHYWLAQLIEVEKSRKVLSLSTSEVFGVWEDSRLQQQVKELLESSLSTNQITQLLDWLEIEIVSNSGPASVILQAISGSVASEEVVDAVNLRCYHIMFDNGISETLDDRYQWRSLSILRNTISFANRGGIEQLASSWAASAKPFDSLPSNVRSSKLMDIHSPNTWFSGLELWKFACAAWSIAQDGSILQKLAKPLVLGLLQKFNSEVKIFLQSTGIGGKPLVKWTMSRYVKCLFKDYPEVLVLATEVQGPETKEMLNTIFWIASASDSGKFKSDLLEPSNLPDSVTMSFSDIWISALKSDCILNSPAVAEMMIDAMLNNESYASNPLVNTSEDNSFAVKSLLQVPIGILHRKYRERIMKAWSPAEDDTTSTQLDPMVLALKIKTMRFPMFYKGMDFQQLSHMANALATTNTLNLLVSLGLFKELAKLTLDFVFTNIDQARNQEYITDAFSYIQKSAKKAHKHAKHEANFASIALFEVILESIRVNSKALFETDALRGKDVTKVEALVQESWATQLQSSLQLLFSEDAGWETKFAIVTILDAFTTLGFGLDKIQDLREGADHVLHGEDEHGVDLRSRFDAFLASQATENLDLTFEGANSSTILGRQSIVERARSVISAAGGTGKLKMVNSVLLSSTGSPATLGKLLALRQIILSVEDIRQSKKKSALSDSDSSDEEGDTLNLSETYSLLCGQLKQTKSIRHFCLISETLEAMLRTKARSISQWNIDNTLGCISIICSRNGPTLRATRGSTIYLHLCHLFQAILLSHRLKLEGHFHLVIQAIQSLLRCLFIPLPYSSTKTLKHYAPPSWLNTTPSTYPLNATHATAFTRLITLICDPSVSSVTHSSHNNLTSATDKAKRMAGQHMQFVLMSYVRLQLEMKMFPAMREKMIPGIYAIFDTTSIESRRCVSESLDSSGRAVFGMLYKDYIRFGKWKGS